MGRKVAYFGNGYQKRIVRFGRKMWWIPILGGEFVLDRRLGFTPGLMGGNLWLFGADVDSASGGGRARCGGRCAGARRDHAVSRRRRGQRLESGEPVPLRDCQHV